MSVVCAAVVGVAIRRIERQALGEQPGPARSGPRASMKSSVTFVAPAMPIVAPPEPAEVARGLQGIDVVVDLIAPVLGAEHDAGCHRLRAAT